MKSNNILHDEQAIHSCCCCCCYCCCYNQSATNHIHAPNMESICSCSCSISSNQEEEKEEISTGHTTPIDMKIQQQEPIEKLKKKKLLAIEELLQTERDYVQDLSHLVEVTIKNTPFILLANDFLFRFV